MGHSWLTILLYQFVTSIVVGFYPLLSFLCLTALSNAY